MFLSEPPKMWADESFQRRFWAKVRVSGECWLWTGAIAAGYGRIRVAAAPLSARPAHRLAWEMVNGPMPEYMDACHVRACPNKNCVRPDHVYAGTPAENAIDALSLLGGDRNQPKGESHPRARLTTAQVAEIRSSTERHKVLAARFGVSSSHISLIKRNQSWRDATCS